MNSKGFARDLRTAAADLDGPDVQLADVTGNQLTEDAFEIQRLADDYGHEVELGEVTESILAGKYTDAVATLNTLADTVEREI